MSSEQERREKAREGYTGTKDAERILRNIMHRTRFPITLRDALAEELVNIRTRGGKEC